MKIPKLKFRKMSLEENIELIKWAYYENDDLFNIHNFTIKYFPELENLDKNLSKEEINKIIERIVKESYEKHHNLDFTAVFGDYSTLPLASNQKLKIALDDKIRENNPIGHNLNLICHSMGFNLGVIAAEHSKKITRMLLISPEFGEYSDEEKKVNGKY
mgnify:CR=1 FL=1